MIVNHTNDNPTFNETGAIYIKSAVYLLACIFFFVPAGRFHGSLLGISFTTGYDAFKLVPFPFLTWGLWRYQQKNRSWNHSPLILPFIFFFLISLITGLASPNGWQALADSLEILFYLGLFLILTDIPWTARIARIPAMAFVLGNLYLFSAVMRQYLTVDNTQNSVRISGTFSHPNELGAYSILGITILVWLSRQTINKYFSFWAKIAACGLWISIVLSQSRTAIAALIVGCIFFVWMMNPQKRKQAGILFAAAILCALFVFPHQFGRFLALGKELPNPNQINRPLIWYGYLLSELPNLSPFGVGLGPVSTYRFGDWIASIPSVLSFSRAWGPHNTCLSWIVGTGLLGLFFLFWLAKASWGCIQRCPPFERALFSAGLISFAMVCLFQDPFLSGNIPIAWITLIAIADFLVSHDKQEEAK